MLNRQLQFPFFLMNERNGIHSCEMRMLEMQRNSNISNFNLNFLLFFFIDSKASSTDDRRTEFYFMTDNASWKEEEETKEKTKLDLLSIR